MSDDFLRDLRTELRAAAERKSSRAPGYSPVSGTIASPGRSRWAGRAVRSIAAVATLALVAAIVLALARGGGPDREVPASSPTPAAEESFAIPIMGIQSDCGGAATAKVGSAPSGVRSLLEVLRRSPRAADRLPTGTPRQHRAVGWLPVTTYDPRSVRQPGSDTLHRTLHIVPTRGVLDQPLSCNAAGRPRDAGACLVAGGPAEPLQTRCFTIREIVTGKAVALSDPTGTGARLTGLLPDGIEGVKVTLPHRTLDIVAHDNAYERYVDHLLQHTRVSVKMIRYFPAPKLHVQVFNGTTASGLAEAIRSRIAKLVPDLPIEAVGNWFDQARPESAVLFGSDARRSLAQLIAQGLRVNEVRRATSRELAMAGGTPATVIVIVGADLAK